MIHVEYSRARHAFEGLSPGVLLRLGALPVSSADFLVPEQAPGLIERYLETRRVVTDLTTSCSARLHEVIGKTQDPQLRRSLLATRRALHNHQIVRPNDLASALLAAPELDAELSDAARLIVDLHCIEQDVRALAERDDTTAGVRLLSQLDIPAFYGGVLLSSRDLLQSAQRVRSGVEKKRTKALQVSKGLLRYFTRTAFKATPFASFCSLVYARVQRTSDASDSRLSIKDAAPRSLIRLNKVYFGRLWDLLRQHVELAPLLPLELAPSIEHTASGFRFIAGFGIAEVVQNVSRNDAIDLVMRVMKHERGCTHAQLCERLLGSEEVDATLEEAHTLVSTLLRIGMLRYTIPVRTQEPEWADHLAAALRLIDHAVAATVAGHLETAAAHARAYAFSGSAERSALLQRIYDSLNLALQSLDPNASPPAATVLYEDYGYQTAATLFVDESLERATQVLGELTRRITRVATPRSHMLGMRWFFDQAFPEEHAAVPLLAFYHRYAKDHLRDWMERQARAQTGQSVQMEDGRPLFNPFGLPEVARLFTASSTWHDRLLAECAASAHAEEISVELDTLIPLADLPPDTQAGPRSASLFAQLQGSLGSKPARIVVPSAQVFMGFGKYFSRFLASVDDELTELVRRANEPAGAVLAEIGMDSNFNANLHPPIAPAILAYPTGDTPEGHCAITVNELYVRRCPEDHGALRLVKENGTHVIPLDLGFLNQNMRPVLFQLLHRFAPLGGIGISIPSHEAVAGAASHLESPGERQERSNVLHRPRLVIDGRVVIARRSWKVTSITDLAIQAGETRGEYFLRLQRWRKAAGVPRQAFMRVFYKPRATSADAVPRIDDRDQFTPDEDGEGANEVEVQQSAASRHSRALGNAVGQGQRSRDARKPQFIDFASPDLVDLFARAVSSDSDATLLLEEVYPALSEWMQIGGERYASEAVLQFDW
jgi:hypothetical protein